MKKYFSPSSLFCVLVLILSLYVIFSLKKPKQEEAIQTLTLSTLGQLKGNHVIFWGYFDPPTLAHKEIVVQSLKQLDVEKVIVVLNNLTNSGKTPSTNAKQRLEMMQLLLTDYKDKVIFIIQDKDQTIDYKTIKKHIYGKLYIVSGQDSYEKWMQYEKNIDAYDGVIVVPRHTETKQPLLPINSKHITLLDIEKKLYTCSSTEVRANINEKSILNKFLSSKIVTYIKSNNLYEVFAK